MLPLLLELPVLEIVLGDVLLLVSACGGERRCEGAWGRIFVGSRSGAERKRPRVPCKKTCIPPAKISRTSAWRASLSSTLSLSLSLTAKEKPSNTTQYWGSAGSSTLKPAQINNVMPFQKLLGPVLKDSARNDTPTSALEGKVVALYFSASW